MKWLREFYSQYRDYIRVDLLMYILMFGAILVYAIFKFVL